MNNITMKLNADPLILSALREDINSEDLSANAVIPEHTPGEVDLIARDGNYLVFVEVKYRNSSRNGNAAEAVDWRKQRVISRVASFYLMSHHDTTNHPCRFDVIAIDQGTIHWYRNAFEYCP